jgi:hypothetical protein
MSRAKNRITKPSVNGHANGVHKPKVDAVKKGYEPLPEKISLLVNVFTYSKSVGADVFVYTHAAHMLPKTLPRVHDVAVSYTTGYPTDRVRNAVVKEAKANGHQFVLMLDDDMHPDLGLSSSLHRDEQAVPFLPAALEFALAHDGPCCVGAPYTAGPPYQEVVVMKNRQRFPDLPDGCGGFLDKYTRDEAAVMRGIQRVAALPTGVMLVDLRILDILEPPWFSYEFKDPPYNTALASTEDVVFSRNCDWMGIPQYCAWSSWAGHCKQYTTMKPVISPVPEIPRSIWKALDKGWVPPVPQGV